MADAAAAHAPIDPILRIKRLLETGHKVRWKNYIKNRICNANVILIPWQTGFQYWTWNNPYHRPGKLVAKRLMCNMLFFNALATATVLPVVVARLANMIACLFSGIFYKTQFSDIQQFNMQQLRSTTTTVTATTTVPSAGRPKKKKIKETPLQGTKIKCTFV